MNEGCCGGVSLLLCACVGGMWLGLSCVFACILVCVCVFVRTHAFVVPMYICFCVFVASVCVCGVCVYAQNIVWCAWLDVSLVIHVGIYANVCVCSVSARDWVCYVHNDERMLALQLILIVAGVCLLVSCVWGHYYILRVCSGWPTANCYSHSWHWKPVIF